ncbi:MAG: peptidoglycan DD-metalloendopeptidase family protein [Rhizomicrobium sp.]|jgi:murein DD-endopeptidase MepM/ murein hydrolase activator NlpD
MADTLVERAWAWLHATFPERQVYIRSDGRVQFFTFGPTLQATLAGLSLIFLGWVAFASVNVIFKDRIIASKDHRYQQMQSTYENRVADQQLAYDELNGSLVAAEDRFKSTADELERKQETVSKLLGRKQAVDATLNSLNSNGVAADVKSGGGDSDIPVAAGAAGAASDSLGAEAPIISGGGEGGEGVAAPSGGNSQLGVMPQTVEPQPRTGKSTKASFLDNAVTRFASALFHPKLAQTAATKFVDPPALRVLAEQTDRIAHMSGEETVLLVGVDQQVAGRIGDLQNLLRHVGVDPDSLEQQGADEAVGGPLLPISAFHIEGIADQRFTGAYAGVTAHVKELDTLFAALRHVPLTTPVHGQQFELTSGFGARVDPFTRRVAFHPGVDFGGPWGSIVASTAPGVVVWAGDRGGYGNMVEIDHGYGFHTRYGHLSSILVRVGARVEKGSPIGKLGSTGRSTGPHVHYEVWLADVVRDPSRFIEAGRHVLQ